MNELKPEDVMRALAWYEVVCENIGSVTVPSDELKAIAALLREKDAEIERLRKERDDARRDCAVAERNHHECAKEVERLQKFSDFPLCALSGCEAASITCHKTCPDSIENRAKAEAIEGILKKIGTEIAEAINQNYEVLAEHYKKHPTSNEQFVSTVSGKITALRGIEDFIERIKNKTED